MSLPIPPKKSKVGPSFYSNSSNSNRIQRPYSRFCTISSQRRELSPTRTLKWPGHNRVQITWNTLNSITCKCHVTCHLVRRDSSAIKVSVTELKSHLFELYFIGWTIKLMKEGGKPEYPKKTPGDELQKMPHTTTRRFKPQARLKPTQ